jgi:uncharacterized membrane protein
LSYQGDVESRKEDQSVLVNKRDNYSVVDESVGVRVVSQPVYRNLDVLLLTAIVALYVGFGFRVTTSNARLGSFLVLITIAALPIYWYASRYIQNSLLAVTLKHIALAIILLGTTLPPLIDEIVVRHQTEAHSLIHDGALQVEEGARFFLAGQNPYATDYDQTPLAEWDFDFRGITTSPALYHYIYLPLSFMMVAPFLALSEWAIGWFDIRFIYGAFWVGSLALCFMVAKEKTRQMILMITIGLSLLTVPFYVQGRNDVVIIAALLGIIYLLQKEKAILAALVLGLACSFKQTMWFSVPFFFFYVSGEGALRERLPRLLWPLVAFVVPFGGLVLPWFLADPAAFIQDTFTYLSGTIPTSYPISGIGFAELAFAVGAVKSVSDYFPFPIYQAVFGLPVFAVSLWRQYRANTLRNTLWHFALLLFVFGYFARTFNDSYLGFLIVVMACAVLIDEPRQLLQEKAPSIPDIGLLVFSLLMGQQVLITLWPTLVTLMLLFHSLATLLFLGILSTGRRWMLRFALIAITVGLLLMSSILFMMDSSSLNAIPGASQHILRLQNPYTAASAALTAWPAVLLLNAPLNWLFTTLTGWYDFRLLVGILILVSAGLGLGLFKEETQRVVLLLGLILSPVLVLQAGTGDVSYFLFAALMIMILLLRSGKYNAAVFVLATGCSAHWVMWLLVPYVMLYLWDKVDRRRMFAIFWLGLVLWLSFFLITDPSSTLSHLLSNPGDADGVMHGLAGLMEMNRVWTGLAQGGVVVVLVYALSRRLGRGLALPDVIIAAASTGLVIMFVGHTIYPVVGSLLIIWGGIGLMLSEQGIPQLEAVPVVPDAQSALAVSAQ